ncbi:MAG: YbgF trimerization domain-containing protein, partial [Polaromonas sp.]|nr:YbgF trimerization domain-containing protein [Polaromonas sp.]
MKNFRIALVAAACAMAFNAHALFEDGEARKAILEMRQRLDLSQQRTAEDLRKANEDNAQLRRSLLELSGRIDALRNELAQMRGQGEQMTRELSEVQRRQKDLSQGLDDRLSKFEPSKVTVDGREFVADPAEKQEFEAALAVMRKGEFAAAQTAFSNFL